VQQRARRQEAQVLTAQRIFQTTIDTSPWIIEVTTTTVWTYVLKDILRGRRFDDHLLQAKPKHYHGGANRGSNADFGDW